MEEVAKAVGGGYCRLQMPLRLALGVRETVAGHRLGALEGGGGYLKTTSTRRWVVYNRAPRPISLEAGDPPEGVKRLRITDGWTPSKRELGSPLP